MSNRRRPRSIAAMQKSGNVGLPERSHRVCLAAPLLAKIDDLEHQLQAAVDEEKANRRLADNSRSVKLAEQIETLKQEMADYEVTLYFRAIDQHLWRAWRNEHPPREDVREDQTLGINYDALIDSIGDYLTRDKCDPVITSDDEHAWVLDNIASGDRRDLALLIYSMHEQAVDIPKSQLASLIRQRNAAASRSPKHGESANESSTDGPPKRLTSTTTQTET